ncbi:MAG: DUF4364 family protein [Lachnospiraceae bacterium]|nr:DUF4364 family protein [Lachnospiraceae bacterium]
MITDSNEANVKLTTLYKCMILYMLKKAGQPLTTARIYDFMLGKQYTNYFNVNSIITELINAGFIASQTKRNKSHLVITEEGLETIDMFPNEVSPEIKKDIKDYLLDHEYELRDEVSVQTNFQRNSKGEYVSELIIKEAGNDMMNIKISLPTQTEAEAVCLNFEKKNSEIYKYIMQELL